MWVYFRKKAGVWVVSVRLNGSSWPGSEHIDDLEALADTANAEGISVARDIAIKQGYQVITHTGGA